jgi:EF-P beta-lysylation protein EpmB
VTQIIPKKPIAVESKWQKELANSFTTLESLLNYLQIPVEKAVEHNPARKLFPMRVPRPFADLMQLGDIHDPLLKQVMPSKDEFIEHAEFVKDPLLEQNNHQKGILHKYFNRALIIVKGGCAVNCRYCFRRHFPYQENAINKQEWQSVLAYIQENKNLDEIILSGGDPLMAKDEFLHWICNEIVQIKHIKRIRIHTRFPVVIPSRIETEFFTWFAKLPIQTILVTHINHANEVSTHLKFGLQKLRDDGVTLLNQAVLLKDINDNATTQIALNEALFDAGVMPYYLHLLDKVAGASHFDVSRASAVKIMREVMKRQPGYLVPKLVREIGGQPGKTPIDLALEP